MSLPTASAPIAVLVLAWDETVPAVRALVEATEAAAPDFDSVVVLVPAGPATEELTQEEFLPLANDTPPAEPLTPAPILAASPPVTTEAALLPTAALAPLSSTSVSAPALLPAAASGELPVAPAAGLPAPGFTSQPVPSTVTNQPLVRIIRLSDYSLATLATHTQQVLPAPTWVGTTATPAAPYQGNAAGGLLPASVSDAFSPAAPIGDFALNLAPALAGSEPLASRLAVAAPQEATVLPHYSPAEPLAVSDPETAAEPTALMATADTSTTELGEEAADELADSFSVDVTPVQAGWPEALASLQKPAAFTEVENGVTPPSQPAAPLEAVPPATAAASAPATQPEPSALRPPANSFDAPNLNFQIIQYARFAVPLALATQPFAVIYAPAWPTWLAAQELRHRTGRPLVVHVAALAAGTEPVELAAGWPAEIQRQALHQADLILTETLALAHRLRDELNLPAHRVRPVLAADAAAVAQALRTAQRR